ncbi:MAG: CorA family divalent cation transporter [Alcanivoracaceae bacterium]
MERGLVHALLLDGKGGARRVGWNEVDSWQPEQGVLWLHFDYTVAATREWLLERSGLPEMAIEALLTLETRPRVTTLADAHLINLRGVNLTPRRPAGGHDCYPPVDGRAPHHQHSATQPEGGVGPARCTRSRWWTLLGTSVAGRIA